VAGRSGPTAVVSSGAAGAAPAGRSGMAGGGGTDGSPGPQAEASSARMGHLHREWPTDQSDPPKTVSRPTPVTAASP
jgi:hypothetical protein